MLPVNVGKQNLRKTRIVCISDTHSHFPADGAFKLPKGDVLIHAGDLTNQGSLSEVQRAVKWIEDSDFEVKIVIAGNHDLSLDKAYCSTTSPLTRPQLIKDGPICRALLRLSPSITYLEHDSATIRLTSPYGPQTTFRVFGSPYIPTRGDWAFQYDAPSPRATQLWDSIPLDTDIVVTHTPAYNHCDASPKWGAAGCKELRKALWRVRPRLAVCGHVHEARGAERVRWKLGLVHVPFMEEKTTFWEDRGKGTKKMSLLDLMVRGGEGLDNDGSVARRTGESNCVSFSNDGTAERSLVEDEDEEVEMDSASEEAVRVLDEVTLDSVDGAAGEGPSDLTKRRLSRLHQDSILAKSGRSGRRETCFVNAAIMARSFGKGPKQFNKPIVIDIDLPVYEQPTEVQAPTPASAPRARSVASTQRARSIAQQECGLARQFTFESMYANANESSTTTSDPTLSSYSSSGSGSSRSSSSDSSDSEDTISNIQYI